MTNWELLFSTPSKTAMLLNTLQYIITHDCIHEQCGKYYKNAKDLKHGDFKEYYGTDLGTALNELVNAPLDGLSMTEDSTLEWLQEEAS